MNQTPSIDFAAYLKPSIGGPNVTWVTSSARVSFAPAAAPLTIGHASSGFIFLNVDRKPAITWSLYAAWSSGKPSFFASACSVAQWMTPEISDSSLVRTPRARREPHSTADAAGLPKSGTDASFTTPAFAIVTCSFTMRNEMNCRSPGAPGVRYASNSLSPSLPLAVHASSVVSLSTNLPAPFTSIVPDSTLPSSRLSACSSYVAGSDGQ